MKKFYTLFLLLFFLTACGQNVTEEDFLVGGTWVAIAGYEDGKAKGEPNCHPLEEGSEFRNENTVYNASFDRDFDYWLYEDDGVSKIHFGDSKTGGSYNYQIKKISDDEIVLVGLDYSISKGNSCYLERK